MRRKAHGSHPHRSGQAQNHRMRAAMAAVARHFTCATRSAFVVPGTQNGMPASAPSPLVGEGRGGGGPPSPGLAS
jgi:hypothetical protein